MFLSPAPPCRNSQQRQSRLVYFHPYQLRGFQKSQVFGAETYTLGLHRTEENLEVAKKENSVILIEDDYKQQYAGFNPNSSESYIIFEFLQDKNMKQSVNFAQLIQKQFRVSKRVDKGVHQAGFLVLRQLLCPAYSLNWDIFPTRQKKHTCCHPTEHPLWQKASTRHSCDTNRNRDSMPESLSASLSRLKMSLQQNQRQMFSLRT